MKPNVAVLACVLAACDPPKGSAPVPEAGPEIVTRSVAEALIENDGAEIVVRVRRMPGEEVVAQASVARRGAYESFRLGPPDKGQPASDCVASRDVGNLIQVACIDEKGAAPSVSVTLHEGVVRVDDNPVPTRDDSFVTILRSIVPVGSKTQLEARWDRDEPEQRCEGITRSKESAARIVRTNQPDGGPPYLAVEIPSLEVKQPFDEGSLAGCRAKAFTRALTLQCEADGAASVARTATVYALGNTLRTESRVLGANAVILDCDIKVVFDPRAACQVLTAAGARCEVVAR